MTTARRLMSACILLVLAALDVAQAADAPPPPAHDLTPTDIEAFLDGLIPLQLETNDIAGATVAIVKDGQVLFAKGYGVADVKTRAPVSAENTLFRIGSVTKTFTWTAVMQLVEQGKLDLDADVNAYLDFEIPHTFGKPVTLRNLMTHRPGFQEAIKNLGAQNSGKPDLAKYLRENTPDQIFEPGSMPSYSNYGAALAGYIVERVSGQPFEAYLEDHIYKPLGMTHTSIRQPLPADLLPAMSSGYNLASDEPIAFEIVSGYPAGSQSSSAIDMAKYMIAHLSGGAFGDARILKPETTALMHDTVVTLDPRANGMALGFYEAPRNGMRIIGHGGDTIAFHSDMHLIPSQNLGFFVSYNSTGRGDTSPRGNLWRKFLDRYFPYTPPVVAETHPTYALTAADVAGSYRISRRAETSLLKAFTELSQATLSVRDDGAIEVDQLLGPNGKPRRWTQIDDGVFRDVAGQDKLVFRKDENGRVTMLTPGSGVQVFERAEPPQTSLVHLSVLGASMLILMLNLILWPVAAFVRWHYDVGLEWRRADHLLRLATMLASAALLTMVIGIGAVFIPYLNDPWKLDDTLDPSFHFFQYIGIAGAAGTLFAVWNAAHAWRSRVRSFWGRMKETLVAVACFGLVWFAWTMNMFDLSLRY